MTKQPSPLKKHTGKEQILNPGFTGRSCVHFFLQTNNKVGFMMGPCGYFQFVIHAMFNAPSPTGFALDVFSFCQSKSLYEQ